MEETVKPRAKALAGAVLLVLLAAVSPAAGDVPATIKARLEREKDPIKRAQLEIRLAESRLDDAVHAYDEGSAELGLAGLKEMFSLLSEAHDRMFETGRNPRKKPKGFKEAEIKFREMSRRLVDLRMSVPLQDREPMDKIIAQMAKMQEHLLHGLMQVKGAKK
jgi:hypothetical protein